MFVERMMDVSKTDIQISNGVERGREKSMKKSPRRLRRRSEESLSKEKAEEEEEVLRETRALPSRRRKRTKKSKFEEVKTPKGKGRVNVAP